MGGGRAHHDAFDLARPFLEKQVAWAGVGPVTWQEGGLVKTDQMVQPRGEDVVAKRCRTTDHQGTVDLQG
jgi:hypothetical protein